MTLPSPLVPKKVQTYLVWRHSNVISDVMSKTRKSPKIAKIMVFRDFFKQKLHFLAMMCVKVCLHMFLLQINQINMIKHSESVSWNKKKIQKTRFVCNFHWKSVFGQFFVGPSALFYATPRHNPGPIFFLKMVLNRAQGLKEKSHEVLARKNNNRLIYNKKFRGGRIPPPPPSALLGLKCIETGNVLETIKKLSKAVSEQEHPLLPTFLFKLKPY